MRLIKDPIFFERYGYFQYYGQGCMLVYWSGLTLEYVQFTPMKSPRKTIISKELLEKYKKEVVGV